MFSHYDFNKRMQPNTVLDYLLMENNVFQEILGASRVV